jgi:ABC-type transport system involved in multi-copper enzyme maturation permease subunit
MDRANRIRMVMVTMAMISSALSMDFMAMLVAFLFLFVLMAVAMAMTVVMLLTKVSVLMEESHTDDINNKTNDGYNNHLSRLYNRRVIDSLKRFDEDIETNEYQEDTIDEARKSLESIKSIGEFAVSR